MIQRNDYLNWLISFKDKELINRLKDNGFKNVKTNVAGKRFSKEQLIDFLSDVDGAIVGLDKIDASVLQHAKKLKIILYDINLYPKLRIY